MAAVLEHLEPEDAAPVARVLLSAGFTRIEISVDSSSPFASASVIASIVRERAVVGIGSVTETSDVRRARDAGCAFVSTLGVHDAVARAAVRAKIGLQSAAFTTTECLQAVNDGADTLVLFPAFVLGPEGVGMIKHAVPASVRIMVAGGVGPGNFSTWIPAGVHGFVLGPSIYIRGWPSNRVAEAALQAANARARCLL